MFLFKTDKVLSFYSRNSSSMIGIEKHKKLYSISIKATGFAIIAFYFTIIILAMY